MIATKFPRELIRNRYVFRELLNFNYYLGSYLHESHRKTFFGEEIDEKVWICSRSLARISDYLLEASDLKKDPIVNFPTRDWNFLLLPVPRFFRVARHIGAIVLGSLIRSSIAREEVLSWKRKLGEDVFSFAMSRGMFLPATGLKLDKSAFVDVERLGFQVMMASFAFAPECVSKRALLKIPVEVTPAKLEQKSAEHLVNSVVFLLENEWHSLFTMQNEK